MLWDILLSQCHNIRSEIRIKYRWQVKYTSFSNRLIVVTDIIGICMIIVPSFTIRILQMTKEMTMQKPLQPEYGVDKLYVAKKAGRGFTSIDGCLNEAI